MLRVLVTLALLVALPGSAVAATVQTRTESSPCSGREECADVLAVTFTAQPGEENRLRVRFEGPRTVVLEDDGAGIRADAPCVARSERAVACTARFLGVSADLGDGADRADVTGLVRVSGGPGADVLTSHGGESTLHGGDGDDVVTGSDATDHLDGGNGLDVLRGGAGNDQLNDGGAGPERDVLDGGPGVDAVGYSGRREPLVVDLGDPAPDGAAGEGDELTGIESIYGGLAADRLVGTPGPNRLSASGGDGDVLLGGDGDDELYGDDGTDRLEGGAGRDGIQDGRGGDVVLGGPGDDGVSIAGGADRVDAGAGDDTLDLSRGDLGTRLRCGGGADVVTGITYDQPVLVPSGCERVRLAHPDARVDLLTPLRSTRAAVASVDGGCGQEACRMTAQLRLASDPPGGRLSGRSLREPVLGRARGSSRPGRRIRDLKLRLSPRGRRLLARRGTIRVRVIVIERRGEPLGDASASFLTTLRR